MHFKVIHAHLCLSCIRVVWLSYVPAHLARWLNTNKGSHVSNKVTTLQPHEMCATHCVSPCTSHCRSHSVSHCTSHCASHCPSHRASHCASHCVSHCASHCASHHIVHHIRIEVMRANDIMMNYIAVIWIVSQSHFNTFVCIQIH